MEDYIASEDIKPKAKVRNSDSEKSQDTQKVFVKVKNIFNGPVELDFGRDHEIRFYPGEVKEIEASVLQTPQFIRESKKFRVY